MTWYSKGWRKIGIPLTTVVLMAGCNEVPTTAPASDTSPVLAEMVSQQGFSPQGMKDLGTYVVVEGDIRIEKVDLLRAANKSPGSSDTTRRFRIDGPRRQWMVDTIVSQANVANITVDLSAIASNSDWTAAMRSSMAAWNALPGTDIRFIENSPADITVQFATLNPGVVAQGSFPIGSTRKPGSTISISPSSSYSGYTPSQMVNVLVHELGHNVGFRHANWQSYMCGAPYPIQESQYDQYAKGANQVWGTPATDGASVMNACTAGNNYAGFSHYDSVAVMNRYSTMTLAESNNGTYPILTATYPRGAIAADLRLETDITELDDTYTTVEHWRYESVGTLESGGQLIDNLHALGFNNCSQPYDWPFEQDRSYYVLRLTYPQGTMFIGVNGHAINNTSPGWSCWSD